MHQKDLSTRLVKPSSRNRLPPLPHFHLTHCNINIDNNNNNNNNSNDLILFLFHPSSCSCPTHLPPLPTFFHHRTPRFSISRRQPSHAPLPPSHTSSPHPTTTLALLPRTPLPPSHTSSPHPTTTLTNFFHAHHYYQGRTKGGTTGNFSRGPQPGWGPWEPIAREFFFEF